MTHNESLEIVGFLVSHVHLKLTQDWITILLTFTKRRPPSLLLLRLSSFPFLLDTYTVYSDNGGKITIEIFSNFEIMGPWFQTGRQKQASHIDDSC